MQLTGVGSHQAQYDTLEIIKKDEVYIKINCEPSVAQELSDYFTFTVPGHTFMPSFRKKIWDGKIRLFNVYNKQIYGGLISYVCNFAKKRNYSVVLDPKLKIDSIVIGDFIKLLNLPIIPREYQIDSLEHALTYRKCLLVSPTASGKSLIIYMLVRYLNLKTLIIVPTTSLVLQLFDDFKDYGWDAESNCHMVYAGQDKSTKKLVAISTWQSLYKLDTNYFKQYQAVFGDEAHGFKSKSLTAIMTKCINASYRIGTTGTLDDSQTHKLVLEGLFGKVKKVTSTSELIRKKQLSPFTIKALILNYPEAIRREYKNAEYQDELEFLINCEARNKFIKNLVIDLKHNTLLLFRFVEKHGRILYNMIKEETNASKRTIFFVFGGTDADTREKVRAIVEKERNAIIVASYGVFSTGINIRNLHNIVFASPSKSRIRNLQSIGRALRKTEKKEIATLYDIADDLSYQSHQNYTLIHFYERMKMYKEEKFESVVYTISIKV